MGWLRWLPQTYRVDTLKGDDSNPGTRAKPWRTVEHAQRVMVRGDIVIVDNGTPGYVWASYKWNDDSDVLQAWNERPDPPPRVRVHVQGAQ